MIMNKARLEAFSDGVFAIIITIMVLALNAPSDTDFQSLWQMVPIFLSYVLSFVYVAIFWINHHLILMATRQITTRIMWANMNFLFWMSLVPFFTAWVDEHHLDRIPVAAYGIIFLLCVVSFRMLQRLVIHTRDANGRLAESVRSGRRTHISIIGFIVAILMSAVHPFISLGIYVAIAIWWIIPQRQWERLLINPDDTNA